MILYIQGLFGQNNKARKAIWKTHKTNKTMTDKQLERMGIYRDGGRLYPKRYWCNITQGYMNIEKTNETYESIVKRIYERGLKDGISEGKSMRSKEFMDLLNNND